eukprot:Tamp_10357.p1 GENE.Tamp_10357~~Tamp_10357.p1  ORF type:complete len:554 (+),score=69.39 Tamp_10357:205-1662(+)
MGAGGTRQAPIYGGRIPAAQLAGALASHRSREGGRQSAGGATPEGDATIRGGSQFPLAHVGWDVSLRATLWEGTPGEAWAKVAPLVAQGRARVMQAVASALWVLSCVLGQALWLCCGIELGVVHVEQPTVAGVVAGLRSAIASSSRPALARNASDRGPLFEVWRGIKSSGCALADVELDFFAACRHSLLQVATLAFGRWPDHASDAEGDGAAEGEGEGAPRASSGGAAGEGHDSAPDHIKHVFLSQSPPSGAPGADTAARAGSEWSPVTSSATPLSSDSSEEEALLEDSEWALRSKIQVPIHLRAPGCETASLVGSWNRWGKHYELARIRDAHLSKEDEFVGLLALPPGRYEFKFIIDGVWRTDEAWPVAMDSRGIQNNVLVVRDTYTHTHTYIHYTYTHTHQYTHIHTLLAPPPHVLRRDDKCGTSQMHVYTCTDRISQYHTGHSYAYDLRIRDTRHHFRWHPPAHARMHSCTLASIIRGAQRP